MCGEILYSFNDLLMSSTFVFLKSVQFSLNARPKINAFALAMVVFILLYLINSASPIL